MERIAMGVLLWNITDESAVNAKNEAYRSDFIADHVRFIRAVSQKAVHHRVTEHDDEWSAALSAFNEAIEKYTPEKGRFTSFAETVMRHRLTDFLRQEYRFSNEVSFEPLALEGGDRSLEVQDPVTIEIQKKLEAEAQEKAYDPGARAREEIEEVQTLLSRYGFSFFDLADCSPKASKTKEECAKAVQILLRNEDLFQKMRDTGTLPAKEILSRSSVKPKILERHRKYIIAAAEILNGDYPLLASYMDYIRKQIPL